MAKSYLDKTGLQRFWERIKLKLGNYVNLSNKPRINNVELNGNKTLNEIGVQQTQISTDEPTDESVQVWINPEGEPIGIPTKTSDLVNDSGFATEAFVNNSISNAITSALKEAY